MSECPNCGASWSEGPEARPTRCPGCGAEWSKYVPMTDTELTRIEKYLGINRDLMCSDAYAILRELNWLQAENKALHAELKAQRESVCSTCQAACPAYDAPSYCPHPGFDVCPECAIRLGLNRPDSLSGS